MDKKWVELCYDRTNKKLWSYLYRILKSEDDCYDILQTAYLRLIDSMGRVYRKSPDEIDAYLFTIARNLAFKCYAERKKILPIDKMDSIAIITEMESAVEDAQMRTLRKIAVRRAIASLPTRSREFIHLKYGKGLNNAKIAKILQVKIGSVRMLQTRAIRAIRKQLPEDLKV